MDTLKHLLGENHIRVFWAALDALDYVIYNQGGQSAYFPPDVQQAFMLLPQVHEELRAALGDRHPVTIRALTLHGQGLARAQQIPEASETLRRALANLGGCPRTGSSADHGHCGKHWSHVYSSRSLAL